MPAHQMAPVLSALKNHKDEAGLLPVYIKNKITIRQAVDRAHS